MSDVKHIDIRIDIMNAMYDNIELKLRNKTRRLTQVRYEKLHNVYADLCDTLNKDRIYDKK